VWFWKNAYSWSGPIAGDVAGACAAGSAVKSDPGGVESSIEVESPVTQAASEMVRMVERMFSVV